ncbi:MAIP1 protein, partial [Pseudoatta argentina]
MRIIMLISMIRKSVPCNLRRIVASVTYRNKMRTKIAQQYNETNLLSSSTSNVTCRIYCTESDSKPHVSLPMLVTNVEPFKTSFLMPFRLLFFSFKIPQIDKEFSISETDRGIIYAITVISNALANENYDSLEGLVAEEMIEILRTKIETLSSEQRSLIAVNKESIAFQFLSDISTKTDKDHSVQIKIILHYIPGMAERKSAFTFADMSKFTKILVCNYTFTRKYVNNIGGSWIATFVNHYSINVLL